MKKVDLKDMRNIMNLNDLFNTLKPLSDVLKEQ